LIKKWVKHCDVCKYTIVIYFLPADDGESYLTENGDMTFDFRILGR